MPSSHGAPRTGLTHDGGPRWQTFVPRPRREAVHTQRPADVALPPEQGFLFRLPGGCVIAAARTVAEFDQALAGVPLPSLEHHTARGDFSRWARDVLGDVRLAGGLAKLEATSVSGVPVVRDEFRQQVRACYAV